MSWLCETFVDIKTREDATREGQKFFEAGMFRHVHGTHQFQSVHRLPDQDTLTPYRLLIACF